MAHELEMAFAIIVFIAVMIIFSKENLDYVASSLLGAFIVAIVTAVSFGYDLEDFIGVVEFQPLLFILGMQIMVVIAEEEQIFQWVAIKMIRLTNGNPRVLLYVISIVATLAATILVDVTVSIIFVPLMIRTAKILEIKPVPYLFGITISINIGSLFTPFSSSENILIASEFGLTLPWFLRNLTLFFVSTLLITVVLLDIMFLKDTGDISEYRKNLLNELLDPDIIIEDKRKFLMNSFYLLGVFVAFIFISEAYLVAVIGAMLLVLLNGKPLSEYFKKIDWNVIFFFISLFLLIGSMTLNGTTDLIASWITGIIGDDILFIAFIVLIFSSLLSAFLANSPTALMFIVLINYLMEHNPAVAAAPDLVYIALLMGINLGGNFLPQGAACDVMTLNIAKKKGVKEFNYNALLKTGSLFAAIHLVLCGLYLVLWSFVV